MIRIILADDHAVMRRGLRLVLEQQEDFEVIGEAADGREAVRLAESLKPDVAVLDITMPNLNGIEAAFQISAKEPGVAIVVLSMHADEGYVLRALDYLPKSGHVAPWRLKQNYLLDLRLIRRGKVDDEALAFTKHRAQVAASA